MRKQYQAHIQQTRIITVTFTDDGEDSLRDQAIEAANEEGDWEVENYDVELEEIG